MILNILDIGKLEERHMPLRLEPVSLHKVIGDNAKEMLSLSTRDGITLENRVDPELPPAVADRELVSRVVANLLNNAFKHTPSGGQVIVDARSEGTELVMTVSDTGEGIPEDLQPYIFEKFVTGESDNSRRMLYDSGLGLTFCKLAVQSHGGRIWIESRPGQGTTVFVALPLRARSADQADGAETAGASGASAA